MATDPAKPGVALPATADDQGALAPRPVRWWGQTWVRLTVCFMFVATVPLTITAIYTTRRHLAVVRSVAAGAAAERADTAARSLADALTAARNSALAVAEWPVLGSYVQSRDGRGDADFWERKLEVQLRTFMELNTAYRTIVVADGGGQAHINVHRNGTTTSIRNRRAAAESDPADTFRPPQRWPSEWYQRALSLLPRQAELHVIPSDGPAPSAICAALVPRTAALGGAIVLMESDLAPALESVAPGSGRRTLLFDGDDGVIYDSATHEPRVELATTKRQYVDASNRLISVAPVQTGTGAVPGDWTLAIAEPATALESGVNAYRRAFLNVLLGSLLIAVVLGVGIARQVTRPVRRLYDATQRIGKGDFDVALDDETGDEVGALTTQVQTMATQLRDAHASFERRLREKSEELIQAERLATIGRTAAAVAHEINNPSGIIALYAQMLVEKLPEDDPNVPKLRHISEKSQEISRVVRELLDYARKPEPRKAWVQTSPLLQSAISAALCVADGNGATTRINTQLDVDDRVARLFVDPDQATRLLRNLVTNAVHAMPDGGTLTVRCAADGAEHAVINVTDTGTGISEDHARHLFDAFYSTKRFGAGTGLGLAISKEIVERHGGSIAVASRPGRGTTVTVRIPRAGQEAET